MNKGITVNWKDACCQQGALRSPITLAANPKATIITPSHIIIYQGRYGLRLLPLLETHLRFYWVALKYLATRFFLCFFPIVGGRADRENF